MDCKREGGSDKKRQSCPGMLKVLVKRKIREVGSVVMGQKSTIFFIQESKLRVFDHRIIRGLGGARLNRGVVVDVEGSAGGLITLWDEELVTIKDCILNKWCIILMVVLNKFDKELVFCNKDVSNLESERRELWEFILCAHFICHGASRGGRG
ncbi:hypothetical protein Ddye_022035 [Dipteronia dyeriana]|uniref:Uncharacterized protein n=1 Tax=Dipteronia dyeriana TaxID=168575 RepID=A0AAD9U3T1_9ROSI|nr:hypothetical protein Ddye_022035 [Dipteronia dyeriana]